MLRRFRCIFLPHLRARSVEGVDKILHHFRYLHRREGRLNWFRNAVWALSKDVIHRPVEELGHFGPGRWGLRCPVLDLVLLGLTQSAPNHFSERGRFLITTRIGSDLGSHYLCQGQWFAAVPGVEIIELLQVHTGFSVIGLTKTRVISIIISLPRLRMNWQICSPQSSSQEDPAVCAVTRK